jgi:hypothetical protein
MIVSEGNIALNDNVNSKSIIRLKKPIREMFPELKNVSKTLQYRAEYHSTYSSLLGKIMELIRGGGRKPVLLFLPIKNEENT